MQISEHVTINESDYEMYLSDRVATFSSKEEFDKAIVDYFNRCDEFVSQHGAIDSGIIESHCFPD